MSDPAFEAAHRACHGSRFFVAPAPTDREIAAAREALKLIREKISELQADIPTDDPRFGEGVDYVLAGLSPFIYTTEELER